MWHFKVIFLYEICKMWIRRPNDCLYLEKRIVAYIFLSWVTQAWYSPKCMDNQSETPSSTAKLKVCFHLLWTVCNWCSDSSLNTYKQLFITISGKQTSVMNEDCHNWVNICTLSPGRSSWHCVGDNRKWHAKQR